MEKNILKKNADTDLSNCPIRCILSRIGDKWSVLIITTLGDCGTMRFNEINKVLTDISQKMLTSTLRSLEEDGLVSRQIYPEIPPRVEYRLTTLGESLLPYLQSLSNWAKQNMDNILENRNIYKLKE